MKLKREVSYRPELVDQGIELSVRHLKQYFSFGHGRNAFKTKAVHDVSFDIKKGECFGLVGESGCGKTTTGRSLIRLYHITSGSIYFEGYRISAGRRWNDKEIKWSRIKGQNKIKELRHEYANKIKEEQDASKKAELVKERDQQISEIKKHIADTRKEQKEQIAQIKYDNRHVNRKLMSKMQMIFQDPVDSLDPRMTVEDIIQEGLHIQGEHNRYANSRKVADVLERVGLIPEYASRYPHEFSGGQRQRIGIARALVMNPQFLICDEPISALDVSIRAQIINLLNDLKEEMGLTILFIAHDLSVVKYFCDRIGVMYFGELVELTTSDELFRHPLHPYTNALLSAIPKPDPISEKKRQRIVYKPQEAHDYSQDKPEFTEIIPGHWVLANKAELEKYRKLIGKIDRKLAKEHQEEPKVVAPAKPVEQPAVQEEAKAQPSKVEAKTSEPVKEVSSKEEKKPAKITREEAYVAEIAARRSADYERHEEEMSHLYEEEKVLLKQIEEKKREAKKKPVKRPGVLTGEKPVQKQPVEVEEVYLGPSVRELEELEAHKPLPMFESDFVPKKEEPVYSKDEQRVIENLRKKQAEQPKEEEIPERVQHFLHSKKGLKPSVDLPLFRGEKPAPVVEDAVDVPQLESKKPVNISKNEAGEYQVKQIGADQPLAVYRSIEEAIRYGKALKEVNRVSVRVRDEQGKIRCI